MAPTPFDYISIQNTLARYCIALDTKDFELLRQVFTDDADAVYPFTGPVKGVQTMIDRISKRLSPVVTQHALTTQHIEIAEDGKSATTMTYFTGIHFGQGKWKGKEVTAWGKYVDSLELFPGASIPGASGKWLVTKREVSFMSRLGEEAVMDGE